MSTPGRIGGARSRSPPERGRLPSAVASHPRRETRPPAAPPAARNAAAWGAKPGRPRWPPTRRAKRGRRRWPPTRGPGIAPFTNPRGANCLARSL